jgi:hypothetical protein
LLTFTQGCIQNFDHDDLSLIKQKRVPEFAGRVWL